MAFTSKGVCLAPLARYQVGTPYDNYDKPLTIPVIDDASCCSLEPDVRGRPSHYARYASGRRFMIPTCFDPLQMASASSLLFPVSPFEYSGLYLERTLKADTSIWLMSELPAPPDPGSPTSRLMP